MASRAHTPDDIAAITDSLAHVPAVVLIREFAAIYRVSVSYVRQRLTAKTLVPAPFDHAPTWRWRKADIIADLVRRGRAATAITAARVAAQEVKDDEGRARLARKRARVAEAKARAELRAAEAAATLAEALTLRRKATRRRATMARARRTSAA